MTLRAARLDGERDIAVTIEASTPAERLAVFGRASGLSEREQELLGHLAAGTTPGRSPRACTSRPTRCRTT